MGRYTRNFPSSYPDLPNRVAVAATTQADELAWWSNRGRASVHIGAPGDEIVSTYVGGAAQYANLSGTSMVGGWVRGGG